MKTLIKFTALFFLFFGGASSFALTIDEARSKNLVKELPSGYLEVINPNAKAFVEETNKKRRAHYEKIAKENKLTVEQVATKAAQQLKDK